MHSPLSSAYKLVSKQRVDALLITSYENSRYLSRYGGFSRHERDAYLLITTKKAFLFTSPLYALAVRNEAPHLLIKEYTTDTPLKDVLAKTIQEEQIATVGFEANSMTVSEYTSFKKYFTKMKAISFSHLRSIKTSEEIHAIAKACTIADRALEDILPLVKPGITERELAYRLEDAIRKQTADIAFPTIVAFGKNGAVPHHHTGLTRLKKNDSILIDFGASVDGYHSDMTRTFFIGKPSQTFIAMYQAVLISQQHAVSAIKHHLAEGTALSASEIDSLSRQFLVDQGYPSIPHSLGHGIGLAVHEAPSISPQSKDQLTEGMVFSIEPGVYVSGKGGIRIEDLYTITNRTLVKLTHAPSPLITL